MKRVVPLALAMLLLAACMGDSRPPTGAPEPPPEPPRPNVLLVVTDDMRPDGLDAMPFTVRWLVRNGRSYTNAYAVTPLCCPSRATIFTGSYAHNHGVLRNKLSHDLDTATTIQAYLKSQTDYQTGLVGKYLNSWSVEEDPPHFDRWASYSGRYYGKPFNVNGRTVPTDEYSTYHIGKRARQILRHFERADDKPWFLYVATVAPHIPLTPAPNHRGADVPILNRNRALPPSVTDPGSSQKPPFVKRAFKVEQPGKLRRKQWRMMMSVDDVMRGLRRTLRRLDEERDTLVIFTSDQGLLQGEHGLFAKRLPYSESIQVPMLVRWPGRVEKGTDERLVANVDLVPTIAELAGVEAEHPLDGVSLFSDVDRSELFIEQLDNWRVGIPDWASIRTREYQYVEYYSRAGDDVIEREYYDLIEDPWQLVNLLGDDDATNDPDVDALTGLVEELRDCAGAACVRE